VGSKTASGGGVTAAAEEELFAAVVQPLVALPRIYIRRLQLQLQLQLPVRCREMESGVFANASNEARVPFQQHSHHMLVYPIFATTILFLSRFIPQLRQTLSNKHQSNGCHGLTKHK
jgi:hypothetical protein